MDPLDALRPLMASHSPPLHALIVPSEDAHQSEYVADRDQRRAFVSGFTGSAGLAVVTMNEALLWTDGRYFLQASMQLSDRWKLMRIGGEDPVVETWLADNLEKDAMIGVDPWCVSTETAQRWEQTFTKKGQTLVQLERNLVDEIWQDRPCPTIRPASVHQVEFAGQSSEEKLVELRTKLSQEKAYAIIITTLDEVAWLYNLRGQDVPYNPVLHSFAVVTTQSAFLYVEQQKISSEVRKYLTSIGVEIRDYGSVLADICSLAASRNFAGLKDDSVKDFPPNAGAESVSNQNGQGRANISPAEEKGLDDIDDLKNRELPEQLESVCSHELNCPKKSKEESNSTRANSSHTGATAEDRTGLIWVSPGTCCYALYSKLPPDQVLLQQSPLALSKALKNPVELEGFRKCHLRDGAAVVSYFAWLDGKMQEVYGAAGYFSENRGSKKRKQLEGEKLTEVSVSGKLEEFRAKQEHFMGPSFETISSVGPNAAIIHYAPELDKCAEMQPESIYLCDSGGQYLDGTTDITRTVHFGKPSAHEKACYTKVLKGHIALDTAVFPNGTNGHALDILARIPLWQSGLDYRHGTGHGVGSYLNVHEGPHLISFRPQARNVALQASMTVTDEPGYYEDGNFGVRLENVLIVKEAPTEHNFADKGYLTFEHITWVPFQKKLIDVSLLSNSEKAWIDEYHHNCYKNLSPLLLGSDLEWLAKATEPLAC